MAKGVKSSNCLITKSSDRHLSNMFSKFKDIFSSSSNKKQSRYESATDAICAALTAINCTHEVEKNENTDDKVVYFKYQGMNFRAFTFAAEGNNNCNLDYHAGIFAFDDLEYLRQVANNANSSVSPVHFYFIADTKENNYNLYATATLTNVIELPNLQDEITNILEQFFHSQRNFNEAVKKKKEEKVESEVDLFMNQHEIWMTREMEINLQLQANLLKDAEASTLLLTDFLENTYGIQSVEIEYIDICQRLHQHITDTERIHSYLLLEPVVSIKQDEGIVEVKENTATISVFYVLPEGDMHSVMITLKVENDEKNAVYVRVTALREGDCIGMDNFWGNTRNNPKAVSLLLAVDRASNNKKRAEVKYMWDEAMKKREHNEELNDDETYLVRIADIPQLGDSAYFGRKMFNQKRYAEALKFFMNVHEYLEENFFEDFWNDGLREYFARNCYYISFCQTELGDTALATYFAEKACLIYPCPLHTMNYVKSMFRSNDFRLFHEIRARIDEIEEMGSKMKEGESLNSTQAEMYEFLQQAYALALIRFRKWNDAKVRLDLMMNNGPDYLKEWAKKKLEEIKDQL